jgi:hypothetical protein
MGNYYARFRERRRVKLPPPTRQNPFANLLDNSLCGLTKLGVSLRPTALPQGSNSICQDRVRPLRKDRCATSVLQA